MNKFDKFMSMNIDELVDWLDEHGSYDAAPWWKWWDETYCEQFKSEIKDGHEYGWCELHGKCKYFQDMRDIPDNKQTIKMWLETEC